MPWHQAPPAFLETTVASPPTTPQAPHADLQAYNLTGSGTILTTMPDGALVHPLVADFCATHGLTVDAAFAPVFHDMDSSSESEATSMSLNPSPTSTYTPVPEPEDSDDVVQWLHP